MEFSKRMKKKERFSKLGKRALWCKMTARFAERAKILDL